MCEMISSVEQHCEMMDIMLSNYDVLERLVQFLAVADVVVLCSISREWRDVLGIWKDLSLEVLQQS